MITNMKQEDKELLLKDLCARLPYGVKFAITNEKTDALKSIGIAKFGLIPINLFYKKPSFYLINEFGNIEHKPYLRPMSSMTEEEILELYKIAYDTWYSNSLYYKNEEWINFRDSIKNNNLYLGSGIWLSNINKVIDWLNKNMFDYRGLIEKGLALVAPKGMYKV